MLCSKSAIHLELNKIFCIPSMSLLGSFPHPWVNDIWSADNYVLKLVRNIMLCKTGHLIHKLTNNKT